MDLQLDDRTTLIMVDPEPAGLVTWSVAPEDVEQWHLWLDCENRWLASLRRRSGKENTSRAYHTDVLSFFAAFATQRLFPWQVSPSYASAWVEIMHTHELAKSTINRRIAALSSFYHYAATEYILGAGPDARGLWPYANPFAARSLRYRLGKPRPQYPSSVQVTAILAQIDVTTITGLRNLAIIFGMFATTRRVSEWTALRWGDIHEGDNGKWFEYRYKGGEIKKQTLPADAWNVIQLYLKHSGRLETMQPQDYVFLATSSAGKRIRNCNGTDHVGATYDPLNQPISNSYVNQLLKRYGLAAGIPEAKLHAHAMRHAGSRSRRKAGADAINLKDILGHANIQITQTYIDDVLDEPEDPYADTVGAVLPKQLKLLLR